MFASHKEMIFFTQPYLDIEHINEIIAYLEDINTKITKGKVLSIIETLLNFKIIYVFKWSDSSGIKNVPKTTDEIIFTIDKLWFKEAKHPDFYNMVYFGYENWYISSLERLGYRSSKDWEVFVKEKIGDLEQWIEENKPKD